MNNNQASTDVVDNKGDNGQVRIAVETCRPDFTILQRAPEEEPVIFLDSAATSQKPRQVLEAMHDFYTTSYANVHRGVYSLSERATEKFENARSKTARFINAPEDEYSIIFTRSTTESVNLVAYAWARQTLQPGDEIVVTEMEHHSNLIPWQEAAKHTGATLKYIPINENGHLNLDTLDSLLSQRTKMVAFIHQSNVLGTINPVEKIIAAAKDVGALTFIDAAQCAPHHRIDVESLAPDFLAFSSHKMLGPTGIGILCGKTEILEAMEPFQSGGEMIDVVSMDSATWNEVPYKFEAGTPAIAEAIGLSAAMDYLDSLTFDEINHHENTLVSHALEAMNDIDGVFIYGPRDERGPVISFNVEGIHPADLAQFLDQKRIAIRAGHHCAQPLMTHLKVNSTARASFYIYNTLDEVDALVDGIRNAQEFFLQ